MIRVGFVISFSNTAWMGGINYYKVLLKALQRSVLIEPVLFVSPEMPDSLLCEFPQVEIVRSRLVTPGGKVMFARKVAEAFYGRAFIFECLLRRHRISVLSHSGHLGPRSRFPTIGWIPDFQHQRLPTFFSEADRARRDRGYARLSDYCTRIVVSSGDALNDLTTFRPAAAHKADVLHFVPHAPSDAPTAKDLLLSKYDIGDAYFHLPNQFWAHKNHKVVVDALAELKKRGRDVTVVATGATADPRAPHHFSELIKHVEQSGLQRNFRVLGLVPYPDLLGLMQNAVGVINPSFFEGWSTSVEEAKSAGKTVIISDIPVHREQAPRFSRYFSPNDPRALAEAIVEVLEAYSPSQDIERQHEAREELPKRVTRFLQDYETIVQRASSTPVPAQIAQRQAN